MSSGIYIRTEEHKKNMKGKVGRKKGCIPWNKGDIDSEEKLCPRCNRTLPRTKEYFYVDQGRKAGLYPICKECTAKLMKKRLKEHPEVMHRQAKQYRETEKEHVFGHYGKKCVCCGETNTHFLTIDHVNNDGARHRKEIGCSKTYSWLLKNNFPDGFQVLCYNCNFGKYLNGGICPHDPILTL